MLMSAHDGAVDHRVLIVGIGCEMLEYPLPDAGLGPTAEPPMHVLPVAEPLRQIAPRYAGSIAKQHRFDEQPVIRRSHPHMTLTPGQQALDTVPLIVAKAVASHWSAPKWLTRYESKFPPRRNPLNDDTP